MGILDAKTRKWHFSYVSNCDWQNSSVNKHANFASFDCQHLNVVKYDC